MINLLANFIRFMDGLIYPLIDFAVNDKAGFEKDLKGLVFPDSTTQDPVTIEDFDSNIYQRIKDRVTNELYNEESEEGYSLEDYTKIVADYIEVAKYIESWCNVILESLEDDPDGEYILEEFFNGYTSLFLAQNLKLNYPYLYEFAKTFNLIDEFTIQYGNIFRFLVSTKDYYKGVFGADFLETEESTQKLSNAVFFPLSILFISRISAKVIYGYDVPYDEADRTNSEKIGNRTLSALFSLADYENQGSALVLLQLCFIAKETASGEKGLMIYPRFGPAGKVKLNKKWTLNYKANYPDMPIPVGGFQDNNVSLGRLDATLEFDPNDKNEKFVGQKQGSYIKLGKYGGTAKLNADEQMIEVFAKDTLLKFSSTDLKFLKNCIPVDSQFTFDLGVGLSNKKGIYFKGGLGLTVNVPMHLNVLGVKFDNLTILVEPVEDYKLIIELSLGLGFSLGKFSATADRIGLNHDIISSTKPLKLSSIKTKAGFKPPKGIGLKLDTKTIKGGGFLNLDYDRDEYSGIVSVILTNSKLSITGIGIITRLQNGVTGYSTLFSLFVEFGTLAPTFLGISFKGIGLLYGGNKTVSTDNILQGTINGSIESILFPSDPLNNAPRILSDMKQFFPDMEGSYVMMLSFKLGWLSDKVTSTTGIIIEFDNDTLSNNFTIIGTINSKLPIEEKAVIEINVGYIGRLELDQQRFWFLASLYNSRIGFVTLEGQIGFLWNWGDESFILFSLGGFHPQYNPPTLPFPIPRRLSINILKDDKASILFECYLAFTSNSIQVGGKFEIYFGLSAFSINGHLLFDVLYNIDSGLYSFKIAASLAVKLFGMGLFSVGISGLFEGDTPYHIEGKGKISLLFFSKSIPFDHTWGETNTIERSYISIFPIIVDELKKLSSWSEVLPRNKNILVLRKSVLLEENTLLLDPCSHLKINQNKIPLQNKIEKYGIQISQDIKHVSLTLSSSQQEILSVTDIKEKFALSQYQNLDDMTKLTMPGFQHLPSGIVIAPSGNNYNTAQAVQRNIRYEEIIIDNNYKRRVKKSYEISDRVKVDKILHEVFLKGNQVGKMEISKKNQIKLINNGNYIKVM